MWLTVDDMALKWQLSKRSIQLLCQSGKIKGAVRFGRSWAIPENANQPVKVGKLAVVESVEPAETGLKHFLTFSGFEQILSQWPQSFHVSTPDGTLVFASDLFLEGVLPEVRHQVLGRFNVFEEEQIEAWGLKDHVRRAFNGEKVTTKNLKFPNKELVDIRYGKDYAFIDIYQDVQSFPIFDAEGQLQYVVTQFTPVVRQLARNEVVAAKAYVDTHWKEPFSIHDVAKTVNLSTSRLTSLFKQETGFTLHDYYRYVKIEQLCRYLVDPDLMISEVFNLCGISYNSYYCALFKAYTGKSPREYRKHKKTLNL